MTSMLISLTLITVLGVGAVQARAPALMPYESRYYVIETDLPKDRAAYLGRLMDATGQEYNRRFQGFRGVVRSKPRVKVFAHQEDFMRAFDRGSGAEALAEHARGLFHHSDQTVYTYDGAGVDATLKHECFHQFVKLVVGGRLPSWANEGLAEYFSEGEFDEASGRLLLGAVPKWRVRAIQEALGQKVLMPVAELIRLEPQDWNDNIANRSGSVQYLQAWALCHFLIHGEENKYRPFFDEFLKHLDQGLDPDSAFKRAFGESVAPLQEEFFAYLAALQTGGPKVE